MLNFNPERFLRIQKGALAVAHRLDATIADCLGHGVKNLFFLGSGGAGILMYPAARLLHVRSTFPVYVEMPAELVLADSPQLGAESLAVIPSLSGTTKESIEALSYCKKNGATVITLTGNSDTPLARDADHAFVNFAEDDTSSESFYLQSLIIVLTIMRERGELDNHGPVLSELQRLPDLLLGLKEDFEPDAERLAEHIEQDSYHIITGAGSTWPEAFYYGMCILEEMQWIRTRPVHASDFFHGTLELVEDGVSVIALKGEDEARPLVERVEQFAPRYTKKVQVLDTAQFSLPGLSQQVRSMISPIVLATLLERVSAHLEVRRDHPLTTRRYYKRVAY